jgi:hypothetical protein
LRSRSRSKKREGKKEKNQFNPILSSPTTLAHQQRLVPQPCQTCCATRGSTRTGRCPGVACTEETAGEAVEGENGGGGVDGDGIVDVDTVVVCFCRLPPPSGQGRPTIAESPIAMQRGESRRRES